ncbi:uncharacterized protein LOC116930122 [Daphnia magna]|uniref:uncharacterized protein LOC116930122 n=1 Tax=Daphnia magna TaxID=35525 RepID=UPI001E1BB5F8|nr:uncharacterized protein LOC116930122 [Daphnia magna]XP_045036945.1 uncharacterized protein LOC116930122 [Daphnia magna]
MDVRVYNRVPAMIVNLRFIQWVTALLVIFRLAPGTEGIQLLQVSVPSVIQAGEGAALLCDVDMENERLYSVKWYKDDELQSVEFFRFVPRETPQLIVYDLPGINVNKTLSDWQRVYLSRVSLASSGHYRCEVSAEGPSFSSVSGGGHMEVVVLPKKRPTITGGKSSYRAGDLVDVNCTSAASKPAANIRWFINERKANANYIRQYKAVFGDDGLETTVLGLTFEVHESHLQNEGKLTLRCVASVNSIPSDSSSHHNQYLSNNNNPPPAASSTASLGGYEVNAGRTSSPEHFYNPLIIETMSMVSEVRFEASSASPLSIQFGSRCWMSLICVLLASMANGIVRLPGSLQEIV